MKCTYKCPTCGSEITTDHQEGERWLAEHAVKVHPDLVQQVANCYNAYMLALQGASAALTQLCDPRVVPLQIWVNVVLHQKDRYDRQQEAAEVEAKAQVKGEEDGLNNPKEG